MEQPKPADDPFAAGTAFVDGTYQPVGEARLPLLDWGFIKSDCTYDVVGVWGGRFFRLNDHLDRFHASMARLNLVSPYGREEIAAVLHECVRLAGLRDAYVEMITTRGLAPAGSRDPRDCENRFYAFAVPYIWLAKPERQEAGINLTVASVRRTPPESLDPRIKNFQWGDMVAGLFEAYGRGGETAVLPDRDGNVTEGPGFNLFALIGGRLVTPRSGVLEGITRKTVVELADRAGCPVTFVDLPVADLARAEEVFLTSTAGGVIPVGRIDGRPVGDGRPGPVALRLRELYWAAHEDPAYTTPVDYRAPETADAS